MEIKYKELEKITWDHDKDIAMEKIIELEKTPVFTVTNDEVSLKKFADQLTIKDSQSLTKDKLMDYYYTDNIWN